MKAVDVELHQLLPGADPDQPSLVSIHLQPFAAHPVIDSLNAHSKSLNGMCSIGRRSADVYLCVVRI